MAWVLSTCGLQAMVEGRKTAVTVMATQTVSTLYQSVQLVNMASHRGIQSIARLHWQQHTAVATTN